MDFSVFTPAPKYMKQKVMELEEEMGNTTIITEDIITLLWIITWAMRQKFKEKIENRNNIFKTTRMNIFKTFYPTLKHPLSSGVHGTFSK